jgi:chromate reductase
MCPCEDAKQGAAAWLQRLARSLDGLLNFLAVASHGSSHIRLLTICGSLRAKASNAALLDALAYVVPAGIDVVRYDGLADLPPFNPDHDVEPAPPSVSALRAAIAGADALVISSPEYAHGVPGALKNALDWLVSGIEIYRKPVALLNPSPLSLFAHPQLVETLRVMNVTLVDAACLSVPIAGRGLDAAGIAADPDLAAIVRDAVDVLAATVVSPP